MKKLTMIGILISAAALIMTAGCGGGGGGTPPPPPQPTTAVVTILTQGTPSVSPIGGIDITLNLPPGVTVKATLEGLKLVTDPGVVTASGDAAGAIVIATYTAGTGGAPNKVFINVAKDAGFATGEFVTINADIAAGTFPKASDFSVEPLSFIPYDLNGATSIITGLTPGFTVAIQ